MSPVTLQRYRVTFVAWHEYEIIVEALSRDYAIKKAMRLYHLNGIGYGDIHYTASDVGEWHAEPLVPEVAR